MRKLGIIIAIATALYAVMRGTAEKIIKGMEKDNEDKNGVCDK